MQYWEVSIRNVKVISDVCPCHRWLLLGSETLLCGGEKSVLLQRRLSKGQEVLRSPFLLSICEVQGLTRLCVLSDSILTHIGPTLHVTPVWGQSCKSIQMTFISRFIILLRKPWDVLWGYFYMKESLGFKQLVRMVRAPWHSGCVNMDITAHSILKGDWGLSFHFLKGIV